MRVRTASRRLAGNARAERTRRPKTQISIGLLLATNGKTVLAWRLLFRGRLVLRRRVIRLRLRSHRGDIVSAFHEQVTAWFGFRRLCGDGLRGIGGNSSARGLRAAGKLRIVGV